MKKIPGINRNLKTDFAVSKPVRMRCDHFDPGSTAFTRWLGGISLFKVFILVLLMITASSMALAQSNYSTARAVDALVRWMPFLLKSGFFFNFFNQFAGHAHRYGHRHCLGVGADLSARLVAEVLLFDHTIFP